MDRLNRRQFLQVSAAPGMAMALAPMINPLRGQQSRRNGMTGKGPNILWICTDQQRFDTIHALGNNHIRTPNIDKLIATGTAFTRAHCQSPICTPSRASFLTGMYPSTIHACMNGNDRWAEAAPLITKTLADIGYDCGLAGKFHLSSAMAHEPELRPKDDGYRCFWYSHAPHQGIGKGNQYTDWLASIGQDYKKLKKKYGYIPAKWHQTTWCADRAIEFMKEERKGPWLCSVNIYDPHGPFDPPQEYVDRFDVESLPEPLFRESDLEAQERLAAVNFQGKAKHPTYPDAKLTLAKYWAQIELIDENVGRMLDALEETGQRENTVVIFTSDHGEMAGDHGLNKKGCRFYEGLVRVPLIFSWPGRVEQGLRSDALVELVDIAPTLLDMIGPPVPVRMQGQSLLPILDARAEPDKHRDFVRCVYYKVLEGPESFATMIRTREHKLVNYHGHEMGELFDMTRDPHEFENQWDNPEYAAIRFDLMKKSFDALAFAVDTGPPRVGRY
ncbi:MAG: sulfatase-like hydrolase/transferase [Phycisphaerales bacterium]|nr:MAG: sulfatase-like hydrolase/transferase [Phycisphaerales bacterium]